jgi:hypothetical protein
MDMMKCAGCGMEMKPEDVECMKCHAKPMACDMGAGMCSCQCGHTMKTDEALCEMCMKKA